MQQGLWQNTIKQQEGNINQDLGLNIERIPYNNSLPLSLKMEQNHKTWVESLSATLPINALGDYVGSVSLPNKSTELNLQSGEIQVSKEYWQFSFNTVQEAIKTKLQEAVSQQFAIALSGIMFTGMTLTALSYSLKQLYCSYQEAKMADLDKDILNAVKFQVVNTAELPDMAISR